MLWSSPHASRTKRRPTPRARMCARGAFVTLYLFNVTRLFDCVQSNELCSCDTEQYYTSSCEYCEYDKRALRARERMDCARTRSCTCTRARTYAHACMHACAYTRARTRTCTCARTRARAHVRARARACSHASIRAVHSCCIRSLLRIQQLQNL